MLCRVSRRLLNKIIWLIKYREGLIPYILANIYLLATIPFSWLYYDIRYYLEWVDITWRYGFILAYVNIPIAPVPLYILFPRGVLYIYIYATKASYPPLPILLFITTHSIASSITSFLPIIRLIDKLPLVISFNLIYYYLKKNYGWIAGLLWILNHFSYATIYSYQTDLLTSLFLLLSFLEFIKKKNLVKSSIYLALASLIKPLVLLAGILYLIILLKDRRWSSIIYFILPGLVTGLLFIIPYLLVDSHSFLYKAFFFHGDRFPQEYSLWAIPIYIVNYNVSLLPSWLKYIWLPFFLLGILYVFYRFYRLEYYNEKNMVKYLSLLFLFMLLLNKVGNPNYFLWGLPFLIIYMVVEKLYRDRKFLLLYIFVSLVMIIVAPLMTFYTAFVVQGSVFIIEDLSYYSATGLAQRSFDPHTLQFIIADYLRVNAYWFFNIIYMGINISYIIYTLIYNFYLIYLITYINRIE